MTWGKGYAFEAAGRLDGFHAGDVLELELDIIHSIHPNNVNFAEAGGAAGLDQPRTGENAAALSERSGRPVGTDGG